MSTTEVNVALETPTAEKDKDAVKVYNFDLGDLFPADDELAGVAWTVPAGLTQVSASHDERTSSIELSGGVEGQWYVVRGTWLTVGGLQDEIVLRLFIKQDAEDAVQLGTALFPNRFTAVQRMRGDRLLMAAAGIMPKVAVSDDYIWDKIRAAEAEAQRELRVFFQPTAMFPHDPTSDELAALTPGMPWAIDPGYDFGPEDFLGDTWGFFSTRQKPIISITSAKMIYPAPGTVTYDFPLDWLRVDRKYGHIRIVPTNALSMSSLSASIMQLFSSRRLPQALEVRYIAGLANANQDYPELVDLVLKKAALKIIGDRFMPASGSISADGMSQSFSNDMSKYHDDVNAIINGPKGSNGGLMSAIHGIRMGVL
jgi:hypothetical protein